MLISDSVQKSFFFNPEPCYVIARSNLERSSLNGYAYPYLEKEQKPPLKPPKLYHQLQGGTQFWKSISEHSKFYHEVTGKKMEDLTFPFSSVVTEKPGFLDLILFVLFLKQLKLLKMLI